MFRAGAVLESPEGVLRANAERERFWREHYRVQFGDTTLFLRQKAWSLKGVFLISDESGEIGSIRMAEDDVEADGRRVPDRGTAPARDRRVPRVDRAHGAAPPGIGRFRLTAA